MRRALLGLTIAALLPSAAHAAEGDPMPLSEVRSGMQCTGYSVFRGTAVEPFGVEVLDVVGQAANSDRQPRILIEVGGGPIDATGVGPGFSGSPILCPAADGTRQNIGAISETVGDYGGRTVLATPIEQILDTPVDPVRAAARSSVVAQVRDAGVYANARPLVGPLTIGGLRTPALARALARTAAANGVGLLAAPPVPSDRIPPQTLVPGSAVGAGYSSGDLTVAGIGTVAFTRGNDVWAFGHGVDTAGARSLLLQDAYVATIVDNPTQTADGGLTYKLAGAVNTLGTVTSDGFDAIAGRVGPSPATTYVRVTARDADTDRTETSEVRVADETDVGNPAGYGNLAFIAPVAVADTTTANLRTTPAQIAGRLCLELRVRERKQPMRFCNRYVSDGTTPGEGYGINTVASAASADVAAALGLFDTFKGKRVHATHVRARLTQTRAQRQAYLRAVRLPQRVRRGETVRGTLVAKLVRGERRRFAFEWTVPRSLDRGRQRVRFRGADPDNGGGFGDVITIELGGGGGVTDTEGPRTLNALRDEFEATHRYDGIRSGGKRVFRDPTYRIGGVAYARVRVTR